MSTQLISLDLVCLEHVTGGADFTGGPVDPLQFPPKSGPDFTGGPVDPLQFPPKSGPDFTGGPVDPIEQWKNRKPCL
jgi:hypothetical protein